MALPEPPALRRLCRAPEAVAALAPADWNAALRAARGAQVLARLGYRIEDAGMLAACPAPARDAFLAARPYPAYIQTQVRRELRHVLRALAPLQTDLILLKGAAYLGAGLALSRGRHLRDLDILVRRERIGEIERRLLDLGWESGVANDYDQRYYREWMHEIPPLRHPERGLEVDIHHTLLPLTSRLRPDPELFWSASLALEGMPRVRVLCPADMVLHTATHLFYDGEIRGGLGDLWDIDELLRAFGPTPGFWDTLLARAARTDLGRPLYYALTFSRQLMGTAVPDAVLDQARGRFGPRAAVDRLMERLITRVLNPADDAPPSAPVSDWLLYVRSHWLRMPPQLLIPHLLRKATRRLGRATADPAAPAPRSEPPGA